MMVAEDKKKRRIKKTETVRERASKASEPAKKPRRLRSTASKVGRPLKAAHRVGKKEYYLPMPDNRTGRFLNKRRSATPSFFIEAWRELRQVTWPDRRTTLHLTFAVFVFAGVFALIVSVFDYGLDKVFEKLLLN